MSNLPGFDQHLAALGDRLEDRETHRVELLPATAFTIEELTTAYNQSRVDYIVPMPMNATRLREYVRNYDVSLEHSVVAVEDGQILGLSMLGVRPQHSWTTRLGVLPVKRRRGTGEMLMRDHVRRSRELGVEYILLEVIKNNVPAYELFKKLGFKETRELLILRRPPGPPKTDVPPYTVTLMGQDRALELLQRRRSLPSWLDETPSLKNAGSLFALQVKREDGGQGWLVYQSTVFQLGRLVLQTEAGDPHKVACTLAHALHSYHPIQDTKTENFPLDDPHLPGLLEMGYFESFRRIEMRLDMDEAACHAAA